MSLYFITSNKFKFEEAREILGEKGIEVEWTRKKYDEIQTESTGEEALEEVVRHALSRLRKKEIFIDDAGLFISALKGFPGAYSSYVQKTLGNKGILRLMQGAKDRRAKFICTIGYKGKEGIKLFKGEIAGSIGKEERGKEGFGYDPIFIPGSYRRTFAEDKDLKNRISHRRRALDKFAIYLGEKHGKNAFKSKRQGWLKEAL